ncbi:MAG: methylated-DNA--[protein]-cysteine S-methyltransferase [Pseudonocardiaceae bacterium]
MLLSHDTAVGTVTLAATTTGLAICSFDELASIARRHPAVQAESGSPHLDLARRELDEYFVGCSREFTVPVDLRFAQPFDRTVLDGVRAVRYGSTVTYGGLAERLGLPRTAARAVGRAMALNPVLVVVPCHRVVGSDGALVGYAGGLSVKRRLLDIETADQIPQLDLIW